MVGVDRLRRPGVAIDTIPKTPAETTVGCRKVRWPNSPCGSGTPLASAVPANRWRRRRRLKCRARIVTSMLPGECRPPAGPAPKRDNALLAVEQQALGTQPRNQRCALRQCRRRGRDQHRLLGAGRTAHAAVADVPATAHIARDDPSRCPAGAHRALGWRCFHSARRPTVARRAGVPSPRTRRHRFCESGLEAEHALPVGQRFRRRTEAAGPVHGGRTANAAP